MKMKRSSTIVKEVAFSLLLLLSGQAATFSQDIIVSSHLGASIHPKPSLVNRRVKPGDVGWHINFEQACKASKLSGRPVLLFEMMGKLDDEFC